MRLSDAVLRMKIILILYEIIQKADSGFDSLLTNLQRRVVSGSFPTLNTTL